MLFCGGNQGIKREAGLNHHDLVFLVYTEKAIHLA
jgi:hypothetical protein